MGAITMAGRWALPVLLAAAAAAQQKMPEIPEHVPAAPPVDSPWAGKKWKIKFFLDEANSEFRINDFIFAGPQFGFAAGYRVDKEKLKPVGLLTRDGGAHWSFVSLRAPAVSVFALDETHVWVVTEKDLYFSSEFGAQWTKLKRPEGASRVCFTDASKGWAFGAGKTFYRTNDGGKSWAPVPESLSLELTDENTTFEWMEFLSPQTGMLVGNSERPRKSRVPEWMDPEIEANRRLVPTTTVLLETRDGGATWKPSVSSLFGRVVKVDLHMPWSLSLFRYRGLFEFPSEVLEIELRTGKSRPMFRRKDLNVTDIAVQPDGSGVLAGVQVTGRFRDSPIPSRVRMLVSADRTQWFELPVDYRASGTRAMLAWVDIDHAWLATDEGMILKLEKK
jgi:hypothetical protein